MNTVTTRIRLYGAWLSLCALLCVVRAGEVRVGVARVDITPPLGIPMAGYYHLRGADGVLDPLYSQAMVMEAGGTQIALVALDLIGVNQPITEAAREEITRVTGIEPGKVMIAATHAHTGPQLTGRNLRVETMGGQHRLALEYTAALPARIAESVRLAHGALQPARVHATRVECEGLTFNRRYFMRDGSVGWNPGKLNPDIVLPAGPSDPGLGVLYIERQGARGPGQSMATYVNFAMHTDTTGGSRISADWPGALARVLAGYHGAEHQTFTALGACGNLNHLDVEWGWPQSSPSEQHRIGTILGAAVFEAYKSLQPIAGSPLRAATESVVLDLPEITEAEVEEARRILQLTKDDRGAGFMQLVRAYRALDIASRDGIPHEVEVQVLTLGNEVAWVSLPGEVFVELGLAIRKRSPFPHTFIVTMANDNIGYIPDRRSYAEGNYEPESARCAPGSGEKLVEAAVRLLTSLRKDGP
jgi:neutral ceramidase